MTVYNFTDYESIPESLACYMLGVADAERISDIPLDDINSFLNGLEEFLENENA